MLAPLGLLSVTFYETLGVNQIGGRAEQDKEHRQLRQCACRSGPTALIWRKTSRESNHWKVQ